MNELLKQGDKIRIEAGMPIRAAIPTSVIPYQHTSYFDDSLTETAIIVGEVYESEPIDKTEVVSVLVKNGIDIGKDNFPLDFSKAEKLLEALGVTFEKKSFDTSIFEGEYIVVKTRLESGYYVRRYGERIPDEYHVWAKKIGKDEDVCINFYQSIEKPVLDNVTKVLYDSFHTFPVIKVIS